MCFVVNDLQKIPARSINAPVVKSTETYLLLEKEKIPMHCTVGLQRRDLHKGLSLLGYLKDTVELFAGQK